MSDKGFKLFVTFSAIRRHLTQQGSYNYFKYNGKIKTSVETYESHPNYVIFEAVAKKLPFDVDRQLYVVAGLATYNFSKIPWITDFRGDSAVISNIEFWLQWMSAPAYKTFEQLSDAKIADLHSGLLWEQGTTTLPPVLSACSTGSINLLTAVGLNKLVDFTTKWPDDRNILAWRPLRQAILLVDPFITINEKAYASQLKQLIDR